MSNLIQESQLIGNHVITKHIGPPASGTIQGIWTGKAWAKTQNIKSPEQFENHPWNKFYQDWQENFVCLVEYDSPQRNVSFNEFWSFVPKEEAEKYDNNEKKVIYENNVKLQYFTQHPIQDLEIM